MIPISLMLGDSSLQSKSFTSKVRTGGDIQKHFQSKIQCIKNTKELYGEPRSILSLSSSTLIPIYD